MQLLFINKSTSTMTFSRVPECEAKSRGRRSKSRISTSVKPTPSDFDLISVLCAICSAPLPLQFTNICNCTENTSSSGLRALGLGSHAALASREFNDHHDATVLATLNWLAQRNVRIDSRLNKRGARDGTTLIHASLPPGAGARDCTGTWRKRSMNWIGIKLSSSNTSLNLPITDPRPCKRIRVT